MINLWYHCVCACVPNELTALLSPFIRTTGKQMVPLNEAGVLEIIQDWREEDLNQEKHEALSNLNH